MEGDLLRQVVAVVGLEEPIGPRPRLALAFGVVDQIEQPCLHAGVNPRWDRAGGQSQRAFPCAGATPPRPCSVTVARSRSISTCAAFNAACSRLTPGRPAPKPREPPARPASRSAERGPPSSGPPGTSRRPPAACLTSQHRHEQLVLLARRQSPLPLAQHACSGHLHQPPVGSGTPSLAGCFSPRVTGLTQMQNTRADAGRSIQA